MPRHIDGILLSIDPKAGESKLQWVTRNLRSAIASGRLSRGDRLPSHRDLAAQWRVSRGVVTLAYEQLQTEGVLESRKGSGTFIVDADASTREYEPFADILALERSQINERAPFLAREADVSLFPLKAWQRSVTSVFAQSRNELMLDKSLMGLPSLRAQLAAYLAFARGIRCAPEHIMITTGARHALDIVARALSPCTRQLWMEDPGYPQARGIFSRSAIEVVPVPVDDEGIVVEEGLRLAPDARLAFVTPAHQAPTGVALSAARREQLMSWAIRTDAYVIEDDYDGAFTFQQARPPSLKAIDTEDRVIHVGSFNKILFPALRLGYLVMPKALRQEMQSIKAINGWSISSLEQAALAVFMQSGHFARHIRYAERIYARRCLLAIDSIERALGKPISLTGTHGGFHFCIWLTEQQAQAVHELAPAIQMQRVQRPACDGQIECGIVIGFASLEDDAIREAGKRLGECLRRASASD